MAGNFAEQSQNSDEPIKAIPSKQDRPTGITIFNYLSTQSRHADSDDLRSCAHDLDQISVKPCGFKFRLQGSCESKSSKSQRL